MVVVMAGFAAAPAVGLLAPALAANKLVGASAVVLRSLALSVGRAYIFWILALLARAFCSRFLVGRAEMVPLQPDEPEAPRTLRRLASATPLTSCDVARPDECAV